MMPTPTPTTAPSSAALPVISRVEGAGVSSLSSTWKNDKYDVFCGE